MSHSAAFPKILHIGDKQILDLFEGDVEITEKIDGSQFGFGKTPEGELIIRSKGREISLDNADKLFFPAITYINSIQDRIPNGWFFYGETLHAPRHSTLAYDRVPRNHIALFAVYEIEPRVYHNYDAIKHQAELLEVDAVPLLFRGVTTATNVLDMVKDTPSYLGGQNVEGIVVKAYKNWMFLGQIPLSVMSGKYVTEEFKEVHNKDWSKLNTGKGKFDVLKENYRTEARWRKAVQHLRERGELTGTPKDIGLLIKEARVDIETEEKENIKDVLWAIYKEDILKYSVFGLAQWWKEKLVLGENDATENSRGSETVQPGVSGEESREDSSTSTTG
jgi:hypothetical protein